jgi:DNA transformation protein and related proteins
MPPADPFVTKYLKMLEPLGPIETRFMFGGSGLYFDKLHFAITYAGRIYFRVDGATAEAFRAGGGKPFKYLRNGKPVIVVGFQEPPAESLKSGTMLLKWAQRGVEAARRIGTPKPATLQ